MSKGFDWQTEEDAEKAWAAWDEPPQQPPQPDKRFNLGNLSRRWRLLAIVGLLTIIVGVFVWREISQRAEEAMQVIQADVVSSFNLTHTAAQNGDEELFRSLLSGRDVGWTQANLYLFERDQLFDRIPLGLQAGPVSLPYTLPQEPEERAADESTAQVTLSPDLTEAEVVAVRPFTLLNPGQPAGTETVMLRQTALYRRGSQHWLLSPPLNEFWGPWETIEEQRLTVVVPERDVGIATRLAADLDQIVARACSELLGRECREDWRITLRLENDPAVLRDLAESSFIPAAGGVVELPTPTLVGLPVEDDETQAEAGYQALLRGYTIQLLRTTLAEQTGYTCCQQILIYNALVDYQLSQLGLQTWPVTEAEYQRVLDERVRIEDLQRLWRINDNTDHQDDNRSWSLYTLLDFLLRTLPQPSPEVMIFQLDNADDFSNWLQMILSTQPDQGDIELLRTDVDRAWWLAAYQAGAENAPASLQLPSQELYMTCTSLDDPENPEIPSLLRYVPDGDVWEEVYQSDGFIWPVLLPGAKRLLIQEFSPADERWRMALWNGRQLQPLLNESSQAQISLGETDPTGRFLVVYEFNDTLERIAPLLYDLEACEDGNCEAVSIPGLMHWSPDGQHAIYIEMEGDTFPTVVSIDNRRWSFTRDDIIINSADVLYLGSGTESDLDGLPVAGIGYAPFWLGEDEYGFIRPVGGARTPGDEEIVLKRIGERGQQLLLSTADLEASLPEMDGQLHLIYVAPHPTNSDLLFAAAAVTEQRSSGQILIFSINRRSRLSFPRLQTDNTVFHSLGFSPDGRYLVVTGLDREIGITGGSDLAGILLLHDIEQNQTTPFLTRQPAFINSQAYDWSAGGRWLAFAMDDNLVAAVAPDERYARPLIHGYGACTSVAWLNE
jgi:hypothetical protein